MKRVRLSVLVMALLCSSAFGKYGGGSDELENPKYEALHRTPYGGNTPQSLGFLPEDTLRWKQIKSSKYKCFKQNPLIN
jgi:hypothetical protein